MRGMRRGLVILAATSALLAGFNSICAAQTGTPSVTGGSSLVVSREPASAPLPTTAPSLSSVLVVSWQWNAIALASARGWAWSFAPALAAQHVRPVAVRRRALP